MLLVALRGALAFAGACGLMAAAARTAMLTGSLAFLAAFPLLALAALVGTGGPEPDPTTSGPDARVA